MNQKFLYVSSIINEAKLISKEDQKKLFKFAKKIVKKVIEKEIEDKIKGHKKEKMKKKLDKEVSDILKKD